MRRLSTRMFSPEINPLYNDLPKGIGQKEMRRRDLSGLKIGDFARKSVVITEKMIQKYAELSGDYNALHFDDAFAKETIFGKRIAHGGITASIISGLLGSDLPGNGCAFINQTLQYRKPLYVGDTATGEVIVRKVIPEKKRVLLDSVVYNQFGDIVLEGTALMLVM